MEPIVGAKHRWLSIFAFSIHIIPFDSACSGPMKLDGTPQLPMGMMTGCQHSKNEES